MKAIRNYLAMFGNFFWVCPVWAQADPLTNATIPSADQAKTVSGVVVQQADTAKNIAQMIIEYIVKYSFQALGGIIVLVVGWFVGKYIARWVLEQLHNRHIDVTIAKFIAGAVKLLIMTFAVIVALSKFGIEIAPLIAGISVVGFGTSFALQGPLSNYASGITLIFTKPFKVGDIIEVVGVMGEVTDISLARTELKTVDGEIIVVPNKHIIGEIIHNCSETKRLDVKIGISYKADVQKAIDLVTKIVLTESRITNVKPPKVGISEFADSSITIYARVWCEPNDYWDVMFSVNKKIYDEFKRNGIEIPFPQRDVRIIKEA